MNRVFIGASYAGDSVQSARPTNRAGPPSDIGAHAGGRDVYVLQDGHRHRLTCRVRRARVGYGWDGVGPRSTELARAILWLVTGVEPPWSLYRGFARDVVAHFPPPAKCHGERWRLSGQEVRAWLRAVGWLYKAKPRVGQPSRERT